MKHDTEQMILRERLPNLIRPTLHNGQVVEIGVCHGIFSEKLLNHPKVKLLYSVDSWISTHIRKPDRPFYRGLEDYLKAVERLGPYKDRSVILRMPSVRAAQLLKHEKFCMIYIDADHTYDSVCEDIRIWWPLLQPGGIFAGHDYDPRNPGVIEAVNEFIEVGELQLFIIPETGSVPNSRPSWYCFKPFS